MSGAIDVEIDTQLRPKLEAMEQLRVLGISKDENVSVPGVVVAGAQSAGKSSVLEAICGIKLPRGKNITTRVPLVLSLVAVKGASPHAIIGKDADMRENKVIHISSIGPEIEDLTMELAGEGSRVSNTPIYLKVVRNSGATLTLIDLPGITHNSAGDCQKNIHEETTALVEKYMEAKNMVILVVIPAMDDFNNAEAIALAKKYDPQGNRTLGVVTKTDNIQPGCDIKGKLHMVPGYGHVHINLGFIAVANRTPLEVKTDTPARIIREREEHFFTTNPEVKGLHKDFWGIDTLVERIVKIQGERVDEFIPEFISKSKRRIKELQAELDEMSPTFETETQRRDTFTSVISEIRDDYKDMILTGKDKAICCEGVDALNIVPHVTSMYKNYAANIRKEVIPDFFSEDYHKKVATALERVDGMALPTLCSSRVCNALVREVFATEIASRSEELAESVADVILEALLNLCDNACSKYSNLRVRLKKNLLEDFIEHGRKKAKEAVLDVVEAEQGWVWTQNPSFWENVLKVQEHVNNARHEKIRNEAQTSESEPPDSEENINDPHHFVGGVPQGFIKKMVNCQDSDSEDTVRRLQVTISSYCNVVSKIIFDGVPKQVHRSLVERAHSTILPWMLKQATSENLEMWLAEDARSKRNRKALVNRISQFKAGKAILEATNGSSC